MKKIKLIIQKAIINKNLIAFAYSDKSKNKSGVIIEPCLFKADKEGNYFVSGYKTDELVSAQERDKNYLLQQMNVLSVKKLKDDLHISKLSPIKFTEQRKLSFFVLLIFRS